MNIQEMESRLSLVAAEAFENHQIFVFYRQGVYWLAERKLAYRAEGIEVCGYRTFSAIGCRATGFNSCKNEINRIANEY